MTFGVAVLTLLMPTTGTALGCFHGGGASSFHVDFANNYNNDRIANIMIGRISSSRTNRHHRRRTIIHGDVFRHSFIDGHRTHRPSEKDDVLSNTNVIRNESSSPPTLLRPSRAETTKRISAIPRRVILDVTTSLSRVLPEFLRRAFRIFSSLMLAISLFFSISVQSSWARNGSELHTSRLDRRAQSSPSSSSSSSSSSSTSY